MKSFFKFLGIGFIALVVVGAFLPDESATSSTATVSTESKITKPRTMVWFSGDGDVESTKKEFLQGDYRVEWKTYGDCVYYADLSSGNDIFSADAALENTTYLYGIPAGNHFVEVITGPAPSCPWMITFYPTN
jgi:hypothetical protein